LVIQGSPEWRLSRVGHVGCSRLGDVLAEGKGGAPSKTRAAYMRELLAERLTGQYKRQNWRAPQVERGKEQEAFARAEYEARTGIIVIEDEGREHPTIKGFWCSPDGLMIPAGGLEIKDPDSDTHLDTLLNGFIEPKYLYQMAGGCLVYDTEYWDFVSYDDRLPDYLSFYCRRFTRAELPLAKVEAGVIQFLKELDEMECRLRGLR
jgi:hypothetical protein